MAVNTNNMAKLDGDVTIAIAAVVSNCFLDDSQQYLESIGLSKRKRCDMIPLLFAAVNEQEEREDEEEKTKKSRLLEEDDDDEREELEKDGYEMREVVVGSNKTTVEDTKIRGTKGLRSLTLCTDLDFKAQFRVSRSCVQRLMELLPAFVPCSTGRPSLMLTSPETVILLSLWTMGNQESFKAIGDRFGIGQGHAFRSFMDFCSRVNKLHSTVITWPKGTDAGRVMREFSVIGFPDVIGCISCVRMSICGSKMHKREKQSVFLEGVCDAKERFIDVFAGVPDTPHGFNWCEFNDSELCRQIRLQQTVIPQGAHMLGDGAYPLMTYLMVPYTDTGHLTEKQKLFNSALSTTHVIIEQAFHKLFSRFRRLKHLLMFRMDRAPSLLVTGCILHNLCIDEGDGVPDPDLRDDVVDNSWNFAEGRSRQSEVSLVGDAMLKREAIANRILAMQR